VLRRCDGGGLVSHRRPGTGAAGRPEPICRGQAEDGHGKSGTRPESRGSSPVAPIGHARLPQRERSVKHQAEPMRARSSGTAQTIGPVMLLQLSLRLQGRAFGAPGLTARNVHAPDASNRGRGERPGRPEGRPGLPGSRHCGAAASLASFERMPCGRGGADRSDGKAGLRRPQSVTEEVRYEELDDAEHHAGHYPCGSDGRGCGPGRS
jgi:hypothetical protein